MKLKLETTSIFHCPQGQWPGVCEGIEEPKQRIDRPCAKQVRIRFRVMVDDEEYLVGKTFCADLHCGSELFSYLHSWVDGDFDKYLDDDGNIDMDLLVGKKADLHITHGPKVDQHTHPFVNISGIFPRGRITED